jgi:hypothetical protein
VALFDKSLSKNPLYSPLFFGRYEENRDKLKTFIGAVYPRFYKGILVKDFSSIP